MITIEDWYGCYSNGWGHDDLVPEAFAHPAKKAKVLGIRIVEHALERGWIAPGQLCVDPFGGVATIALTLNLNGINYMGCELEPRFVALAQSNMDKWRAKYGAMPGFGLARIVQGDSRRLVEVMREAGIVRGADCCVSSPPFGQNLQAQDEKYRAAGVGRGPRYSDYGESSGQLGRMKEGDAPALICSSPPYASIATGAGGLNTLPGKDGQQSGRSADSASQQADSHYGEAEGQLSTMREGDVAAVISSPPFEGCHSVVPIEARARQVTSERVTGTIQYGATDGQIGNETGDTFWQAAREIVAQCHQILRPGGMAIWVCKDFVRKGKRVPFSDQWLALCESQGFVLECRHRAMLVENGGTQGGLFGEDKALKVSRKSFFRRLAEKKGSPEINWEDVICVRKPS